MGLRVVIPSLLVLVTVACGLPKKARLPVVGAKQNTKFSIQVVVSDAANQNSPIPVDFVMIEDKKLLQDVAKISAKDWFDRRLQVQRDFAAKVQVLSWEWVPGEHGGPISVDTAKGTRGAFIFANYTNAGEHRAAVDMSSPVIINLGPDDFSVQRLR